MSLVIRCLVACFACVSFLLVSRLATPDSGPALQAQPTRKEVINTHTALAREVPAKQGTTAATLQ